MDDSVSQSLDDPVTQSTAVVDQAEEFIRTINGTSGLYPQFILLGDSITQESSSTLQARLQTCYTRRADVINRGFSGYTTSLALSTLPHLLPLSQPSPSLAQPPIRLLTVFFGANDASLPGNPQHVPLDRYISNLQHLVKYPVFKQHGTKTILIAPAPVDEWQLTKPLSRTAKNAQLYAKAVQQLAKRMQIPCVDLWTAFMQLAGHDASPNESEVDIEACCDNNNDEHKPSPPLETNLASNQTEKLTETTAEEAGAEIAAHEPALPGSLATAPNRILANLLRDGLHFSAEGYEVFSRELTRVIEEEVPECMPEKMPMVFQDWKTILGVPKPVEDDTAIQNGEVCDDDTEKGLINDAPEM